jgi:hypothetical protein
MTPINKRRLSCISIEQGIIIVRRYCMVERALVVKRFQVGLSLTHNVELEVTHCCDARGIS